MDTMKRKSGFSIFREVISWILFAAVLIVFLFTVHQRITAEEGEGSYVFGHQLVVVLTGSMEPYMMTNGVALAREVEDFGELQIGDVITFHLESDNGETLRITHRIVDIADGKIWTKGDNNQVPDGIPLTMENVEAEVIAVFNGTAWIVQKWQTTAGKIMLVSLAAGLVLGYFLLKILVRTAVIAVRIRK